MVTTSEPRIVYVLGTARSGTSAIRNAIGSTRYRGAGEGHFIGLVQALQIACDKYYASHAVALARKGTMLSKVPHEHIRDQIYAMGRKTYTDLYSGPFLVDKTPTGEPVLAIKLIEKMWSEVRFVFCKRRGVDNILSKQRKWPNRPFEAACRDWTGVMQFWDAEKPDVRSPWIEIDFYDLENDSAKVAMKLGSLLGLDVEEEKTMQSYLDKNRPESTGSRTHSYQTLDETGWTEGQKSTFLALCGPMMEKYGYGLDSYWK